MKKLTGMEQIVSNQVSFVLSLGLGFVGIEEYFCSCCDLLELAPLDSFEVPHSRKIFKNVPIFLKLNDKTI